MPAAPSDRRAHHRVELTTSTRTCWRSRYVPGVPGHNHLYCRADSREVMHENGAIDSGHCWHCPSYCGMTVVHNGVPFAHPPGCHVCTPGPCGSLHPVLWLRTVPDDPSNPLQSRSTVRRPYRPVPASCCSGLPPRLRPRRVRPFQPWRACPVRDGERVPHDGTSKGWQHKGVRVIFLVSLAHLHVRRPPMGVRRMCGEKTKSK